MKNFKKLALCALVALAAPASASDIRDISTGNDTTNQVWAAGDAYNKGLYSYYSYDNSSNTAGSVLTGSDTMKARTSNAVAAIENATAAFTGQAGGAGTKMINGGSCKNKRVWLGLGWTNIRNDVEQYEYSMNFWTASLGGDMKLWNDRILIGLAAHYTFMKGDTKFNQGQLGGYAYGVNPYIALKIAEMNGFKFSLLAVGGWEHVARDDWRTNLKGDAYDLNIYNAQGTETAGDRSRISSKPKSDTWSGKISAVVAKSTAKTDLSLAVGYAYMQDKVKSFTETATTGAATRNARTYTNHKFKVNQLQTKLTVGYKLSAETKPYVSLIWNQDLSDQTMFTFKKANVSGFQSIKANEAKNTELGGALGLSQNAGDNFNINAEYAISFKGKLMTQSVNAKLAWKF